MTDTTTQAARDVLAELVALKDLKDAIAGLQEEIDIVVDDGRDASTCGVFDEWRKAKADYRERQPAAWEAARAALAQPAASGEAPSDDWQHLKRYGYAPGNYMSKCFTCGETPVGMDKRAITCRPCAEKKHAALQRLTAESEAMGLYEAPALPAEPMFARLIESELRTDDKIETAARAILAAIDALGFPQVRPTAHMDLLRRAAELRVALDGPPPPHLDEAVGCFGGPA